MLNTNKFLFIVCVFVMSINVYGQDTLYISGKMYLGAYEKIDSTAEVIEFLEFQSDRKLIVPFSSVTKEKKSNYSKTEDFFSSINESKPSSTEEYFVVLDDVDAGPTKRRLLRDSANYFYGPSTVGLDLISTILVGDYRMPGNGSIGAYFSYLWNEKYTLELNYRRGINVPKQETFNSWSDEVSTKYLSESFGFSFLVFPDGQIKFAPLVGVMFRYGSGIYFHEIWTESYGIDPETGVRDVYQNQSVNYEKRSANFSDLGFLLGYRINITQSLNLELRIPLYQTNSQSRMYSYENFSNFLSEEYRLQWSYGNEDYRNWQAQFKVFLIYRFGGQAR